MDDDKKTLIKGLAVKLEKVAAEVIRNQGFTSDTEKLLILLELLKEQVPHENSGT